MGRDKLKRNLCFKPLYKEFIALQSDETNTITLLHEEIEALYLMDNLGLYQADAAQKMGVSRPTFARIIKSAREKVSMMLISGAKLVIEDEKKELRVAVASAEEEKLVIEKPSSSYIYIYTIDEDGFEVSIEKNPAKEEKPAQLLPTFLQEKKVNFFVATKIGEGLKNALLAKGIFTKEQESFSIESFMQK